MTQVSVSSVAYEPRLRLVRDENVVEAEIRAARPLAEIANRVPKRPLVVDLDGTLVRSDLLIETAFSELGTRPQSIFGMLRALAHGKAALKHRLAEPVEFDPAILPYDDQVLAYIRRARAEGRPVYLASASNRKLVGAVAGHLGLFTGWFASDESNNLAGHSKTHRLVEEFGSRGFDYIGNDAADLAVWQQSANCIAVRASTGVVRKLAVIAPEAEHLAHERPTWRTWAQLIRVHQYAKNGLVFVAMLAGHMFEWGALFNATLAFVAFSLCASSVYLLNDLIDLRDDRLHGTKCNRPLASGAIPLLHGVMAAPLLLIASVAVAATVSWAFLGVLLLYFAITAAYSLKLKRLMLLDVIILAALYTMRVIGGAVAVEVFVSPWLLAFCMSLFLSLALVKRFVELRARLDANKPDPTSRGYRNSDVDMISSLAAAAGLNAVTVFALYISTDAVRQYYSSPQVLWLACPVLTYWIARILLIAHRREMPDDPVVFAIKDRVSLVSLVTLGGLVLAAM